MTKAEKKIQKLIEEMGLSPEQMKKLKSVGIAGLGGMAGAGLDLYFSGKTDIDDFIKPIMAWGAGGAFGAGLQVANDKKDS